MARDYRNERKQKKQGNLPIMEQTEKDMQKNMAESEKANDKEPEKQDQTPQPSMEGEIIGSKVSATKGVQVRMPEDVYLKMMMYKLKHQREGITLQEIVITATREWLGKHE